MVSSLRLEDWVRTFGLEAWCRNQGPSGRLHASIRSLMNTVPSCGLSVDCQYSGSLTACLFHARLPVLIEVMDPMPRWRVEGTIRQTRADEKISVRCPRSTTLSPLRDRSREEHLYHVCPHKSPKQGAAGISCSSGSSTVYNEHRCRPRHLILRRHIRDLRLGESDYLLDPA